MGLPVEHMPGMGVRHMGSRLGLDQPGRAEKMLERVLEVATPDRAQKRALPGPGHNIYPKEWCTGTELEKDRSTRLGI